MNRYQKLLLSALLLFGHNLCAERVSIDVHDENKTATWIALPYAFNSETMGTTLGVGAIFNGYIQPQMTSFVTAFRGKSMEVGDQNQNTEANTYGGVVSVHNYRPWFSERLFVSFLGSYAYYPQQKIYVNGSNDSVKSTSVSASSVSPLITQGYNNWGYMTFRYVLPWGENATNPITTYKLDQGIPVNRDEYGGGTPIETGRSILELKPFYTKWTADKLSEEPQWQTAGLRLMFQHDNTDYIDNPLRGYGFKTSYTQDFGGGLSTQSWNALEGEYSQYIDLSGVPYTRHSSLALNVWSAYSPSWDHGEKLNSDNPNAVIDAHRPPPWEGARLGGWNRLRAYDSNRFNDKAAIYYGAEYRVIPEFNPMKDEKWFPFPIDWFEFVAFAEAGRVAPNYQSEMFYKDLKSDVGFSIRALAAKVPVRFDMATGSEGSTMWVMIQQPF